METKKTVPVNTGTVYIIGNKVVAFAVPVYPLKILQITGPS